MQTSAWPASGTRLFVAALVLAASGAAACAPRSEERSPGAAETATAADTGIADGDTAGEAAVPSGDTTARGRATAGTTGEAGDTSARATDRDTSGHADTSAAAAASLDTVEGIARQVGNVPFVTTVVQGTDTVAVTGPYEDELSRASGIRVRIVGRRVAGGGPGPALEVSEYRLLSVSGETPQVGRLRRDGEGYYLESRDGEIYRLGPTPPSLRERLGALVWVVTSERGAVRQYGILRSADSGLEDGG